MKKTGTITINDKIITVNEITVKQMLTVKDSFNGSSVIDALQGLLPLLTDASAEFLLELAPSELKALYEKVKEVNSDFFDVLPLDRILAGYKETVIETITKTLSVQSALSLPQVMGQQPTPTDGDGSLNVSTRSGKSSQAK